MTKTYLACLAPVALIAVSPAIAQDLDTSQLSQHADVVRQGILVDKTVRRNQARAQARAAPTSFAAKRARAKATCANRGRAAALHGEDDPKVKMLYRLCERLGF